MLFNSTQFLLFFAVVAFAYFLIICCTQKRTSQIILLLASLYFYGSWNPFYLVLILFSVAVTFASGIFMERFTKHKKLILVLSLVINLGILFFFKYYNFFANLVERLTIFAGLKSVLPQFSFLLPVGISFYTFQALGYSVDVYRGNVKAEKDFITYALFVTFFPQLVAGPIERSGNLLPQFKEIHAPKYDNIVEGLILASWGLFKKVCIADTLALYVDLIYGQIVHASGVSLVLATVFFAFQIFCDFSGYSDMAIGIAKVLGFNLMKNFDKPYFSTSIVEFWRRWHISLSTWFKDYVYIPLGGNRVSKPRHYFNLFITFLISGLWHGASLHFVAWGALHGAYQIAEIASTPLRQNFRKKLNLENENGVKPIWKIVQTLFTFALVCVAWVLFRCPGMYAVLWVFKRIFFIPAELWWAVKTGIGEMGLVECFWHLFKTGYSLSSFVIIFGFLAIFLLLFVDFYLIKAQKNLGTKLEGEKLIRTFSPALKWLIYYALFYGSILPLLYKAIQNIPSKEFVYFQF